MTKKKKLLLQIVFFLFLILVTFYCVFDGEDLGKLMGYISELKPVFLALSIACVVFFIWGEATVIWYMLRSWKTKIPARRCYLYSCAGFFFSCITPSATGGQPAQIYFMKRDKIPVPVAAVILMVVTITYKLVLVVIGTGVLLLRPARVMEYLEPVMFWCYLGVALNIFCVTLMCFLVFHPSLAMEILLAGETLLTKWGLLRSKKGRRKRIKESMEQYRETAAYLAEHRQVVLRVFLVTVVQRFILFSVTGLTYLGFGLSGESFWDILLLQAMISTSVDMLPLPGGMGISEMLFLKIFLPVFGQELLLPGMTVSRGISYYGQLLVSALFTLYAAVVFHKEEKSATK